VAAVCLAPGSALTARENRKNHVKTCKMYTRGRRRRDRFGVVPLPRRTASICVYAVYIHVVRVFVPFVGYCHKVNA